MNPDLYNSARAGHVDLAVSHYGHRDAEQFVMDGLGEWPRMVFSNQMALVGPASDPAKIRGLEDAVEAFKRIAATNSPFVVNEIDGIRYLVEVLWNGGRQTGSQRLATRSQARRRALREAEKLGAYIVLGANAVLEAPLAAARSSRSSRSCSPTRCQAAHARFDRQCAPTRSAVPSTLTLSACISAAVLLLAPAHAGKNSAGVLLLRRRAGGFLATLRRSTQLHPPSAAARLSLGEMCH